MEKCMTSPRVVSPSKNYLPVFNRRVDSNTSGMLRLNTNYFKNENESNDGVLYALEKAVPFEFISPYQETIITGLGTEEFENWTLTHTVNHIEDLDEWQPPTMPGQFWLGWKINTELCPKAYMTLGYCNNKDFLIKNLNHPSGLTLVEREEAFQTWYTRLLNKINFKRNGEFLNDLEGYRYRIEFGFEDDLETPFTQTENPDAVIESLPTLRILRISNTNESCEWAEKIQAKHLTLLPIIHNCFQIHAKFVPMFEGDSLNNYFNIDFLIQYLAMKDCITLHNYDKMSNHAELPIEKDVKYLGTVTSLDHVVIDGTPYERNMNERYRVHVYSYNGIRVNILEVY